MLGLEETVDKKKLDWTQGGQLGILLKADTNAPNKDTGTTP